MQIVIICHNYQAYKFDKAHLFYIKKGQYFVWTAFNVNIREQKSIPSLRDCFNLYRKFRDKGYGDYYDIISL